MMSPQFVYKYLNQGEYWYPNGVPRLPITEMNKQWRTNAIRWLERNAEDFLSNYKIGELEALSSSIYMEVIEEQNGEPVYVGEPLSHMDIMSDNGFDTYIDYTNEAEANPVAWIRETSLHKALVERNNIKNKEKDMDDPSEVMQLIKEYVKTIGWHIPKFELGYSDEDGADYTIRLERNQVED
jgi:hypothetical protein